MTNPNVDVRRFDFPKAEAIACGEDRILRFKARQRTSSGTWAVMTDLSGFSNLELYVFDKLKDGGLTVTERRNAAVFYVPQSAMNLSTAPNIDVPVTAAQTALVRPGERFYELWGEHSGLLTRLAYGFLSFSA